MDNLLSYFHNQISEGISFNEIGRLNRISRKGSKYLMNYMLCYAFAFGRYMSIEFCYFDASPSHCDYYQKHFNCIQVLPELVFTPFNQSQTYHLMKATANSLPAATEHITSKIFEKFISAGKVSAINLKQITSK